ncbi:MAG: hypothetical protein Q9196_003062 [Gyalolechia fulgens]
MVVELLDKNLYQASCEQRLDRLDIKRAGKVALEGLSLLHGKKRAHTDVKPDNLLVNLGSGHVRFSEIKLGDLGDSVAEDDPTNTGQHIIGAPIYRAPELICYLLRRHIFVPDGTEPDDDRFPFFVLMLQIKYFGPFPETFFQLLDEEGAQVLRHLSEQCNGTTDVFSQASSETISPEDKDFICYLMRLDPRDRPSSKEALTHSWFKDID